MTIKDFERELVKKHTAWPNAEEFLSKTPTLDPKLAGGRQLREFWAKHNGRENLFPQDRTRPITNNEFDLLNSILDA